MRTIIVATGKNAPNGYGVQKYDNEAPWNVLNGCAPNGVNATRWLRKTQPDPEKLSLLARWLVEHVPTCVAGKMPSINNDENVYCYNGKTEGDMERLHWRKYYNNCAYGATTEEQAKEHAESACKCYDLDKNPAKINWLFDKIKFEESDEAYWERQAQMMLQEGIVKIIIGNSTWTKE